MDQRDSDKCGVTTEDAPDAAPKQFEADLGRHIELETEFLLPGARMMMKGETT